MPPARPRNVRAYHERGLLPPPEKRGRVGIYDDTHLARLRLIDILLQRGFTTTHISDFISGWENGKDLDRGPRPAARRHGTVGRNDTVEFPLSMVREFLGGDSELN